jgi:hypothetical protein
MSDEKTRVKKRNELSILLGIVGAAAGYFGTLALLNLSTITHSDPILAALIVLFVICPIGAIVGLLIGVWIGRNTIYAVSTATPWLRPAFIVLQFEVRLPPGAAVPPAQGVTAELQTDLNTTPAEMKPDQFRSDDGRPVVVGQVDLAFRTNSRQLEVKVPGRMDRTYQIKIPPRRRMRERLALGSRMPTAVKSAIAPNGRGWIKAARATTTAHAASRPYVSRRSADSDIVNLVALRLA